VQRSPGVDQVLHRPRQAIDTVLKREVRGIGDVPAVNARGYNSNAIK
jgi:hypothetical protein